MIPLSGETQIIFVQYNKVKHLKWVIRVNDDVEDVERGPGDEKYN